VVCCYCFRCGAKYPISSSCVKSVTRQRKLIEPISHGFICFNSILNRQKVPPPSERDIISLTLRVVVAEKFHTTSKRRHVPLVGTQIKRWGTLIGVKRPRAVVQLGPVAWDTWKHSPAGLRMDSGKELRQRKWHRHRSSILITDKRSWRTFSKLVVFTELKIVCPFRAI